ncbi:hypothetical protein SS50377_20378 [Spironucleus salmonicida]|uniref:Uncharacterized protein n=1 Tax=Spironucleus salmonicida TaxID=348837 RepID=V6LEY2_9EUKA|nr:hypothetical protein SS50377_20378 [Spironucleus salmonicida]|eukprot:EST43057.1 Hypothetical protein SS50377_17360 [Spironucleus salmonicida]
MDVNQQILQQYRIYQKFEYPPPIKIDIPQQLDEDHIYFNPQTSTDLELYLYQIFLKAQAEQNQKLEDMKQIKQLLQQVEEIEQEESSSSSKQSQISQELNLSNELHNSFSNTKSLVDKETVIFEDIITLYQNFRDRYIIEKSQLKQTIILWIQIIHKLVEYATVTKIFTDFDRIQCLKEIEMIIFK